jgi:hypothetical protein
MASGSSGDTEVASLRAISSATTQTVVACGYVVIGTRQGDIASMEDGLRRHDVFVTDTPGGGSSVVAYFPVRYGS